MSDLDSDDRIATALADGFPGREVQDLSETGPSWNEQNRTVGAEFTDGERVFLKIATDGDGSRIARECAAIDYVDATRELRVPTIVASDSEGDVPYLATESVSGDTLLHHWRESSEAERAELTRRMGTALAELHSRQFDGHGRIVDGDADDLVLDAGSWTEVLVARIEELREIAPCDRFDHHYDEVIAAVEANRELLDDAPATLVHGDPARPNCVFDGRSVGLLDWELAHVGDPGRELHRARDQLIDADDPAADRLAAALHEGYRSRAGSLPDGVEARRPVYDAVRFLGRSGFFPNWVRISERTEAELAGWIDEEMERRLTDARPDR